MHLLGASYPTNLLLNVLMCLQSAQQLPKCPRKENLQACPDPNRTRILGGDVFCGTDQPAYGHTPVFVRLLKKQRLKQFVWGAWHFCTEVKCSSATQHHYIPPPVSGLSMALGDVDQYVCASCVFYYPDLFSALRQMPDRCARALPKKKRHASQPRLFSSVYLIGGISTCLHSSSVPFFRQMLRPQRGRACNWVVV